MESDNKHFIKVTENALTPLSSEQKVVLNRRNSLTKAL